MKPFSGVEDQRIQALSGDAAQAIPPGSGAVLFRDANCETAGRCFRVANQKCNSLSSMVLSIRKEPIEVAFSLKSNLPILRSSQPVYFLNAVSDTDRR